MINRLRARYYFRKAHSAFEEANGLFAMSLRVSMPSYGYTVGISRLIDETNRVGHAYVTLGARALRAAEGR